MDEQLQDLRSQHRDVTQQQNVIQENYQRAGERGVEDAVRQDERQKTQTIEDARMLANVQMKQLDNVFEADRFNASMSEREIEEARRQSRADGSASPLFKDIRNKNIMLVKQDIAGQEQKARAIKVTLGAFDKWQEAVVAGKQTTTQLAVLSESLSADLAKAGINRQEARAMKANFWGLWYSKEEDPALLRGLIQKQVDAAQSKIDSKKDLEQQMIFADTPDDFAAVLKTAGITQKVHQARAGETPAAPAAPVTAAPAPPPPAPAAAPGFKVGDVMQKGTQKFQKITDGPDSDRNSWKQLQ